MEKRCILPLLIFFVHIVLVSIDFVDCGFIPPVGEEGYQVLLSLAAGSLPLRNVKDRILKKLQSLNSGDQKDGSQQMKAEKCYFSTTE